MTMKNSPWRPTLCAATLALAGALPMAAQAGEEMRVVRDPETGQLRAPNAAEARALDRAAARLRGATTSSTAEPAAPQVRVLPSGALSADLDESTLMYSVARTNEDGSLDRFCVQGADKAQAVLKAPKSFAKPITAQKTARGEAYELK
jgi:hypothetical protein